MIEAATLTRLAAERRPVLVTVPTRPGSDARSHQLILVLWHEPATPENRRAVDAWRILVRERDDWRPAIVQAGEMILVEMRTDGAGAARPFPPIDVSAPVSRTDARQLAEAACLAGRDRLRVEFSYRKDGHPIEQRAGVASGVRDDLLFVEDGARAGQLRSFRLDRIAAFRAVGEVPRWDGAAYRLPSEPRPWGDDPFAGFDGDGS